MVLIGAGDTINKRARQLAIPIGSYLIVQTLFYAIIVFIIAMLSGGIKWARMDIIYGFFSALFGFTAFTLMLHSLTHGSASVNYAIFRSSFVFSTVIAILLLHERISPYKIIGLIFTFFAIVLFFYGRNMNGKRIKSMVTAIVAMLIAAAFQVVLKLSTGVISSTLAFAFTMNIFFLIFVIAYNILFGKFRFPKQTFVLAPTNGILMALATISYITALKGGDLSTTVPIIQLSFIITALLAAYFLKESLGIMRVFGILCAATAILCLGFF
jgi:drug/metabolite transporter (DMT)-like permease